MPTIDITITGEKQNYRIFFSDYGISRCDDQEIIFSVGGNNPLGKGQFSNVTVNVLIDEDFCDFESESCNSKLECHYLKETKVHSLRLIGSQWRTTQ